MDLLSLLAKLTLDKTEYDSGLEEAEKEAKDLQIATPKIPKTDNREFEEGIKEAENTGNIFKDVMVGVWDGIKGALVTTGIVGTISGIVSSLRQGIALATKNGDAISKGAKSLQISNRAYQEFEYTLGKSNIKISDLNGAMSKFDAIRSGKITEDQATYFEKLGINAEEASSGLMSAETMLTSVMDSLADYKGSDKGAIIDAFFGKSAKWTEYFDKTSDEIKKLKQEADDLGLIMSDESVENAVKFSDATERLADRLESIKRSFGEGILPVITDAVEKLMMIMDFFSASDKRSTTEKYGDIDSKFAAKISDIESSNIAAKTLAQTLFDMGDTSGMDATHLAIWKGTAESLIKMIPTLSGVIDTENGTISDSVDGIGKLIDQYTELEKETAYQTAKAEKQNLIDQQRNKLVEEATKANDKLAEAEGNRNKALDEYNAVLEKYGIDKLGYDATTQDIQNAQLAAILNAGDEYMKSQAALELQNAAKPLTEALTQAQAAQAEVERLQADISAAEAALAEWTATQGENYGAISATAQAAVGDVESVTAALNGIPSDVYSTIHISTEGGDGIPHAKGAWSIPTDNYHAMLHRGEMVLTASQARKYREGEGGGFDMAVMASAVESAMMKAAKHIAFNMDGKKAGDVTTDRVSENISNRSYEKKRAYGG